MEKSVSPTPEQITALKDAVGKDASYHGCIIISVWNRGENNMTVQADMGKATERGVIVVMVEALAGLLRASELDVWDS